MGCSTDLDVVGKQDNWWEYLNPEQHQRIFRMSKDTVIRLQAEIDYENNEFTTITNPKLLCTLWILASTQPIETANKLFRINEDITVVLCEMLQKIINLGKVYITWPDEIEANTIEKIFENSYGFPDVLGILGSLYITLDSSNIGEDYCNEQNEQNMIVLQVVCDCNMLLRDVYVGCPGSKEIPDILKASLLYKKLTESESYMVKRNKHLLGGTRHPKMDTILTPYNHSELTTSEMRLNALHASLMDTVENTLKCLQNRFPRLRSVDNLSLTVVSLLVTAACVLHNFTKILDNESDMYLETQ